MCKVIVITNGIKFAITPEISRHEAGIIRHNLTREETFLHKRFKTTMCIFRIKH